MLKQLLSGLTILMAGLNASAQYYGQTLFVEGFDGDEFPSQWTQVNKSESDATAWTVGDNSSKPFSAIDPDSKHSAKIAVKSKEAMLTLTSPEIDAGNAKSLQVGFYGYELNYTFRGNIDFRFRVSNDGGETWTDLFSSLNGSSFPQSNDWTLFKYTLPEKFDNSKLLLQFYIDASTAWSNPQALDGFVDGVFVSLLPDIDATVTGINYSTNDKRPSSGAYGESEPLKLTVSNSGSKPLTQAEFYYTVNGGAEISENYTFATLLEPGESTTFSFSEGVDLSAPGTSFVIVAGVRVPGDPVADNNRIIAYVENELQSVPYVPAFEYIEDGRTVVSKQGWETFENNWEYGWDLNTWGQVFWYTETEMNDDPNDAYLVSRPVRLSADKPYRLQFSAESQDDDYPGANIMEVLICTDSEMMDDPIVIWENDNITSDNALDQAVNFTVPEDGNYYIGFHSLSEPEAAVMMLYGIGLYGGAEKDVALVAVNAPAKSAYTYGNAEKVKVTVANYGINNVPGGSATVKVSLDGNTVLTEAIPQAIPAGGKTDHELSGTLDLSDLGTRHDVRVWIEYSGDEDETNNATEFVLESDVTLVPYIADLGTSTEKSGDVARWTAKDSNSDGYTFMAGSDTELNTYVFSYGGGMYGLSNVTLASSDDHLLSRHIMLEGGKEYKLAYNVRLGIAEGKLPLQIKLVNVADKSTTPVSDITVENGYYRENVVAFNAPADGIYQLQFSVVDPGSLDYRIYLGKFRVAEAFDRDLSVENILLPSAYVSEIHSYPVGVTVRNNGKLPVEALTIEAVSPTAGNKSMSFSDISLEPDATYSIYFNEDFVFDGTGIEELTVTATAEGDEYAGNNSATATLTHIEPYALPYNPLPKEALTRTAAFNLNRDNALFSIYRAMGEGFFYVSDGTVEANDYVATPAIQLAADKALRLSFNYYVLEGDITDFEVFAYNAATGTKVPVIDMNACSRKDMTQFVGFFDVPAAGAYSICFQPKGKAASLFISASINVSEASSLPDLAVTKALSHTEPAVYGDNEKVEIQFRSNAQQGVQAVPFELEIGGKTYYSYYTQYTAYCEPDENYTISFTGVDLSAPGSYEAVCRAIVPLDTKPEDNSLSFTITSLPVVDLAVTELTSPVSGKLGHEEQVSVVVENKGKGTVANAAISCTVSHEGADDVTITGTIAELNVGEPVAYTFPTAVDLDLEGVYTFTVTVTADGDVNPDDNTLIAKVNSTRKNFDAGVSAVVAPVDAAFGTAETVTVAVTNYGETELFDVPVTVSIVYAADDNATPQTLSGVVPAIEIGATVEYTLPGTVDLKRCGNYTLTAKTQLSRDVNADNDEITTTLRCLTQDVGVSAIISPVTGEDLGVCQVIVAVTNYGEADVKDIPMEYQIGTMPQLATMTDEVKAGETKEFTFPVPYEFTTYRKATVKARTRLADDIDTSNDAMEIEIENLKSGVGSITVTAGLWPNPVRDFVTVSAPTVIEAVEAYDMSGRLAATFHGENTTELRLALNLVAGQYTLRLTLADGTVATARLVVL